MKKSIHVLKSALDSIHLLVFARLLVVMLLYSISRLAFYLLNKDLFGEMPFFHMLNIFRGGLQFDLTAVLYVNMLYITLMFLPFKFRYRATYQKGANLFFVIGNAIALAVNCIDMAYFSFTLRRTTWNIFSEFANDATNFRLLMQFFADYWYILVIWLVFLWVLIRISRTLIREAKIKKPAWFYLVNVLLLLFSATMVVGGVRGGFKHSTRPITLSNAGAYVNEPVEVGIVLNTPFSLIRTFDKRPLKKLDYFSPEELAKLYSPVHIPSGEKAFRPYNVVVIILESFGKEYIGTFNKNLDNGQYNGYTPFLDSLIGQSKTFLWSYANGKKSIDAMPSVLASIPSMVEPYVLSAYSGNRINSLASLLKGKGYDCSFFHGAPNGSMGFDAFAQMAGFDHYYGMDEYGNDADFDGMWGIWDEPFFQFFAHKLSEKETPFMAAIFSVSSHHPYKVPEKYEGRFPKGTQPMHQCIGYTDFALKRFFDTASRQKWFENTLFVITADHTNQTQHKKYHTSVGTFAIPILFYKPGSDLRGMEDRLVQQIDIMPSILGYLHYDKPYIAFGDDVLSDTLNGHFVNNYLNGIYQLYQGNMVLQSDGKTPRALYNFKQDILLQNNLKDEKPLLVDSLMKLQKAFEQQYNNRLIADSLTVFTDK